MLCCTGRLHGWYFKSRNSAERTVAQPSYTQYAKQGVPKPEYTIVLLCDSSLILLSDLSIILLCTYNTMAMHDWSYYSSARMLCYTYTQNGNSISRSGNWRVSGPQSLCKSACTLTTGFCRIEQRARSQTGLVGGQGHRHTRTTAEKTCPHSSSAVKECTHLHGNAQRAWRGEGALLPDSAATFPPGQQWAIFHGGKVQTSSGARA